MREPRIEYCFDYVSPYAYLAWHAVQPIAARHGATLVPMPVLFAGLLEANGTKGPAEVPKKRAYLFHDVSRSAAVLGIPIAPPPAHPFRPLVPLRVTLAAPEQTRAPVVTALHAATWGGGGGSETEEAVTRALFAAGIDAGPLVRSAGTDAIKAALRAATDEALARGAFGVPTLFCEGQMFFGLDSLPHLDRYLGGDPRMVVDPARLASWQDLPSGAARRT